MDDETRRFFSLAEKILSRSSGFLGGSTRMTAAFLDMVPKLPAFANAAKRVPEIKNLLSKLGYDKPPHGLERVGYLIPEELVSAAILRLRIPLSEEDLPQEEARRLALRESPDSIC